MQIELVTKRVTIDNVAIGDYVKAYDHDGSDVVYKRVSDYFTPEVAHEKQALIEWDGGSIVTSDSHRMWVGVDGVFGYVETKDINPGDRLFTGTKEVTVSSVSIGKQTEETSYRDMTVEGDSNYFVSPDADTDMILGHNSATVHFPFWHGEIRDIIVLKNNRGTDENRVRKLDYSIQLNELFYKRVLANKDFTLFSPIQVPDLYESMGDPAEFERIYTQGEKDFPDNVRINAREFFGEIINERIGTGRIYIMNMDHCNTHSSFNIPISMSNLCLAGDTSVDVVVDGTPMTSTLREIVDAYESGKTVTIQSKDIESDVVSQKPITDAAMTAKNAKLMRITDSVTGKSITCTPNHKVFTKNRGYVEAGNLVETDELDIV